MIAIAYTSKVTAPMTSTEIRQLDAFIVEKNARLGVTGYLSYGKGRFFQYMEGPANVLTKLMESISVDPRHTINRTLQLGPVEGRRFNNWRTLNLSGLRVGDIRIQDLLEDLLKTVPDELHSEEDTIRIFGDMLDEMAKLDSDHVVTRVGRNDHEADKTAPFVVAMGASAGGLQPLQSIIKSLKSDIRAAFVVIQHFPPTSESLMDSILQRETSMAVRPAADGMAIEAGEIYLIPPGENLEVSAGTFKLSRQQRDRIKPQFPVDICFKSIAREYADKAIAVVLSGTGSDGARGAKVVNDAGGLVLVQSPDTAEFTGMPTSCVESGMAHQVLAPVEIAEFLNELTVGYTHDQLAMSPARREEYVASVVELLTDSVVDFTHYKNETLFRRIERRRVLLSVPSIDEYLEVLRVSDDERAELRSDILISVTSFFRDNKAWDALKSCIANSLQNDISEGETFRAWVTACSTGEEAYTVAIILTELMEELDKRVAFKIYATDIERGALEMASAGLYSERSLSYVSEDRRRRYFDKKLDGYQISPSVRQNVIFAPHNFIKNAPFTRMNLVSCRNVLIYMQPELQQLAIKMLHFSLKVNGVLFLGPSETLGNLQSEFYPLHREWNQYKKLRDLRLPLHLSTDRVRQSQVDPETEVRVLSKLQDHRELKTLVGISLNAMAESTGDTCVLVDGARNVLLVVADPAGLLQMYPGEPTVDLAKLLPRGLRPTATFAVARAFSESINVVHKRIDCSSKEEANKLLDLLVQPHLQGVEGEAHYALVTVRESAELGKGGAAQADADSLRIIGDLKKELADAKGALQTAINELESSNDGQRSINEQLSAANEELQSTNEELQSVNEELYTVNYEYQTKIHELSDLNQDLDNLLDSTNLGVIFLDSDLNIRRFTDVATRTINLLPSDIGRPLIDMTNKLDYEGMLNDMRRVLSTSKKITKNIDHEDGRLTVSIHPYRAGKGLAQGLLITFRHLESSANELVEESDFIL